MKDVQDVLSTPGVVLLEAQDLGHTDTKSALVDLAGFEGCAIVVAIGALTGVDGSNYLTPILYEGDTSVDTALTAVAAADIKGPAFSKVDDGAEDSVVQMAIYVGAKRYVGVNLDYTSTGISAGVVGVYAFPMHPLNAPKTSPAAVSRT